MVSSHSSEAGFTIVEVLFAVVVLTILAIGVVGGERGGLAAARAGVEEAAALGLLQERLDTLRAEPGSIPLGDRTIPVPDEVALLPDAAIEESAWLVEPGLVEVDVLLHWRPRGAERPLTRRLTTWIAREDGR